MVSRFALALILLASPALAATQTEINATLGSDAQIWTGLRSLAMADELRNNCPTLEAREWNARFLVVELYNAARAHGFSRQEIRAFQVDDGTETRMRAEVMDYFAQHGVREGDAQTYCALGLSEIAAGSQAGELLRAR